MNFNCNWLILNMVFSVNITLKHSFVLPPPCPQFIHQSFIHSESLSSAALHNNLHNNLHPPSFCYLCPTPPCLAAKPLLLMAQFRFFNTVSYLSTLKSLYRYSRYASLFLQKWMNFRKSYKRPLTPPSFSENHVADLFQDS